MQTPVLDVAPNTFWWSREGPPERSCYSLPGRRRGSDLPTLPAPGTQSHFCSRTLSCAPYCLALLCTELTLAHAYVNASSMQYVRTQTLGMANNFAAADLRCCSMCGRVARSRQASTPTSAKNHGHLGTLHGHHPAKKFTTPSKTIIGTLLEVFINLYHDYLANTATFTANCTILYFYGTSMFHKCKIQFG